MPQREPLSPPLLVVACLLAALPAAWLALVADAVVSGAVGQLAGLPAAGLRFSPSYVPLAAPAWSEGHSPALWTIVLLSGPVAAALLGLALHLILALVRSAAWLRVLALEWAAFATLRLPAMLVAGVAPGGRGTLDELYQRLGEPQSGRWAVAVLALIALWGAARLVAGLAVGAGRAWMRIDGRPFRRQLVRVVVGYPSLAALAAWSALTLWAAPLWMAGWLLLTVAFLQLMTA